MTPILIGFHVTHADRFNNCPGNVSWSGRTLNFAKNANGDWSK